MRIKKRNLGLILGIMVFALMVNSDLDQDIQPENSETFTLYNGTDFLEKDTASTIQEINSALSDDYPNQNISLEHWTHMPLTYNVDPFCQNYSVGSSGKGRFAIKIEKATEYVTEKTRGAIRFSEISQGEADINFTCPLTQDEVTNEENDYFITHTLATAQNFLHPETNLFSHTNIEFWAASAANGCTVEELPIETIHEIGHALGLDHNLYPLISRDIMNPYVQDCKYSEFTKDDLEYLWNIYDPNGFYKPYSGKYSCEVGYYNCFDFLNTVTRDEEGEKAGRKKAQEVFDFCITKGDPHKLDQNKDKIACNG